MIRSMPPNTLTRLVAAFVLLIASTCAFAADPDPRSADMFVATDDDAFDPGLAVGSTFPAIDALDRDQPVSSIRPYLGERGLLFFANRSISW